MWTTPNTILRSILGGYLLTPSLKEKQTQFFHLFKVGKLYITVGTALQITQWLHVYAYCLSTSLYCLYLCVLLVTSYCNVLSQMPLGHCHEYYYAVDYSNKLRTFNLLLSFDWVASSDSAISLKKGTALISLVGTYTVPRVNSPVW